MHAGALISRQRVALLVLCLSASSAAAFEDGQTARGDSLEHVRAVAVSPDGGFDWDCVKTNIPYINYAQDRMEAELYLLVTTRTTGAGGTEYTITIIGQRQFTGMNDTLVWCSKPTDSNETERSDVVRTLNMGLMRYVARTPIGARIAIMYRGAAKPTDVNAEYARYHDQIDQPRKSLTDEEILLNLKSLVSTYGYSVSVGLTYTFGSIYTNVVNPRFFGD